MTHDFTLGEKVVTRAGFTKGEVVELGPDFIDVRSSKGIMYRNCRPDGWLRESDPAANYRYKDPVEFARDDRVYITVNIGDGELADFAGRIITTSPDRVFIAFDEGMKSQWIDRKNVTLGEPPND